MTSKSLCSYRSCKRFLLGKWSSPLAPLLPSRKSIDLGSFLLNWPPVFLVKKSCLRTSIFACSSNRPFKCRMQIPIQMLINIFHKYTRHQHVSSFLSRNTKQTWNILPSDFSTILLNDREDKEQFDKFLRLQSVHLLCV